MNVSLEVEHTMVCEYSVWADSKHVGYVWLNQRAEAWDVLNTQRDTVEGGFDTAEGAADWLVDNLRASE